MVTWRARCGVIRTPGSESGLGKRTGRNPGTAPQTDSTGAQQCAPLTRLISPLLLNIALHGLEEAAGVRYRTWCSCWRGDKREPGLT